MKLWTQPIRLELSIVEFCEQRATRFVWLDRPLSWALKRLCAGLGWLMRPTEAGVVIKPQFFHGDPEAGIAEPVGHAEARRIRPGEPASLRISLPATHVLCVAQHEALRQAVCDTRELVRARLTSPGDTRACGWTTRPVFPTRLPAVRAQGAAP